MVMNFLEYLFAPSSSHDDEGTTQWGEEVKGVLDNLAFETYKLYLEREENVRGYQNNEYFPTDNIINSLEVTVQNYDGTQKFLNRYTFLARFAVQRDKTENILWVEFNKKYFEKEDIDKIIATAELEGYKVSYAQSSQV